MKKYVKNLMLLLSTLALCGCGFKKEPVNPEPVEPETLEPEEREYRNKVSQEQFRETYLTFEEIFFDIDETRSTVPDAIGEYKEIGYKDSYDLVKGNKLNEIHETSDTVIKLGLDVSKIGGYMTTSISKTVNEEKSVEEKYEGVFVEDNFRYDFANSGEAKTYTKEEIDQAHKDSLASTFFSNCLNCFGEGAVLFNRFRNTTEEEGGTFYIDGNTLTMVLDIDASYGKYNVFSQLVLDHDRFSILFDYDYDVSSDSHIITYGGKGYATILLQDVDFEKPNLDEYTLMDF